jgi:patatin-like phospholipase
MADPQARRSKYYAGAFRKFKRIRVLSLDGAGLYGLTEALLLEEMCRRDETFLRGDNISLFAGCSAGAANALILASHENPREAIESGALRELWLDERSWVPPSFPNNISSLMGYAPWMGQDQILEALQGIFGGMTLRDLPHSVVITSYAYSGYGHLKGTTDELEAPQSPPDWPGAEMLSQWCPWLRPYMTWGQPQPTDELRKRYEENPTWTWYDNPDPLAADRSSHRVKGMVLTDSYRHWQPRIFHSIDVGGSTSHSDGDVDVAELAYSAMAPPGFRYTPGGLGDGAAFNMNPTPYAYAELCQHLHETFVNQGMDSLMPLRGEDGHSTGEHELERQGASTLYEPALSVLSVGAGDRMPYMWPPDTAIGMKTAQSWATNPGAGVFASPSTYSLQGGDAGGDHIMRKLMGPRYARLNPPVMGLPLLYAALLARFKPTRAMVWRGIQDRMKSAEVQRACDTVDKYFLKNPRFWADDDVWVSAPLGPLPSDEDDEKLDEAIGNRAIESEMVSAPAVPPLNWQAL